MSRSGRKKYLLRQFYHIRINFQPSSKGYFANVWVSPEKLSPEKPLRIPKKYQQEAERLFRESQKYIRVGENAFLASNHMFAPTKDGQSLEKLVRMAVNIQKIDDIEYIHKDLK